MTALAVWWAGQAGWVRWMLTVGVVVLAVCWMRVAWLYRPRPRTRRTVPTWVGATEGWSPKADAGAAGPSDDMTVAAIAHARDVEDVVRVEVAERLDLEARQAEASKAESWTDWALATIDLDRRLARTMAAFTTGTGRILSAWPDTAQWPAVVPAAVRPATGKRARRDRKRIHQGKAVAA